MKKIAILLSLLALLSFASCGSKPAGTDSPAESAAETVSSQPQSAAAWLDLLTAELPFEDQNMQAIPDRAPALYGIADEDGYTGESALYISSNATPEEIAVFEIDDAFSAEALTDLARARIERQKESFVSYAPLQMPKLESAVIRTCGDYVIVCVCDDNAKAETILASYA